MRIAATVSGRIAGCVMAGCVLVACGQATSAPRQPTIADPRGRSVQAVFGMLSGMFTRPYDSGPFDSFVTRYGTQSDVRRISGRVRVVLQAVGDRWCPRR